MFLHIQPHDPLIARDSRPFQSGGRIKSLNWVYPSVVAGSIRTLLGKACEQTQPFTPELIEALLHLEFTGPFPVSAAHVYLPAPQDVVFYQDVQGQKQQMVLKPAPLPPGWGTNMPHESIWPLRITQDIKATPGPDFWAFGLLSRWLLSEPETVEVTNQDTLTSLVQEERVHVEINPMTHTAEEGKLFLTTGLVFPDFNGNLNGKDDIASLGMAVCVKGQFEALETLSMGCFHPLGGERRLSYIRSTPTVLWQTPADTSEQLAASRGVRMYLASPALFDKGWLPGWLDSDLTGSPPGTAVQLRLRSACLRCWQAISGWSLKDRGPKPLRRMVPAGSIYFFECLSGDPGSLAAHWFNSVSDRDQDRRDGFGTALWGIWNMDE